jgi:bacterioferritin (cytochrome b1)
MMSKKDFADLIRAQIRLEKNTARKIKKLEKDTVNLAAKLFLTEMRFDTEKHAKILQTILDLMKQKETEIDAKTHLGARKRTLWDTKIHSYVDVFVAKKTLEDHLRIEKNMLTHIEDAMRKTDDDALKLLLEHIADDEKKHHKIMEAILKKAFEIGS